MMENAIQKLSWKLKIGVFLIVIFSIITGILNIGVLYLLGTPLLGILLGIIFVWLAKTSIKFKILWTILPIPIVLATFYLFFQLSKAEPETFLIPQNYRGQIAVFYNETCGQETVYENGRRIYKLPESGVLITKFKENRGYLDQKFYLVDQNASKTEIPRFNRRNFDAEQRDRSRFPSISVQNFTKDSVGAFWAYGSETYLLSKDSLSYEITSYDGFERPEKEQFLENKQFSVKAKTLLNQCR